MAKDWNISQTTTTLSDIKINNNLFVEIDNAAHAATFRENPTTYAYNWQIVFLPAYSQIWTQGDFYGTSSYDYDLLVEKVEALELQDQAFNSVLGDWAQNFAYIDNSILPEGQDATITNVENYLYSQIKATSVNVKAASYTAGQAYLTVSYDGNANGISYTIALNDTAAYSYVQSAYAYIEQQINDINADIAETSVSITTYAPEAGKAYLTVSKIVDDEHVENGITYNIALNNVSSYTDMTAYVNERITSLINGAPEALDTLKEIADWISTNPEEGATNLITRVQDLETAYTYHNSAYSYTLGKLQNLDDAYTYFNNAYTYTTNAYSYTLGKLQNLDDAYTYFNNAYTYTTNAYAYTLDKFNEIEDNSYIYVSYNGTSTTKIPHGGTIVVTGDTVNAVGYNYASGSSTAGSTGSINDAIAHIESRIRTAESGGITSIISPNNTITATKTQGNDNQYEIDTDANIIPVTTNDSKNYFNADVNNPDTIEEALVSIDAQVKTNADNIATNTQNIQAILEALNWTIVGGAANSDNTDNP